MENLREVLAATGLHFGDIVKTTIYLVNLGDFDVVNRVYGKYLNAPYPVRATVQVAALPRGAEVEIDAIARKRS